MQETLLDVVQAEFGLPAGVLVAGGRGALGEIWRLRTKTSGDYAIKLLATQPSESLVAKEVAHTSAMISHGVETAASIANRHGGYVSEGVGGWLRVSAWIDGTSPDPADPLTAARLGKALGLMHANAAPTQQELDGGALARWYHEPPDFGVLQDLVVAAERSDPRWAGRLVAFLPTLQRLSGITHWPSAPVLCHRDLHPENILSTSDGRFVILDWDNLGPADPAQELASVLLHWFADRASVRGLLIKACVDSYLRAGGTGHLTTIGDFALHLADRLNFLARQLETAANPQCGAGARSRAATEIRETLHLLPPGEVLAQCLSWAGDQRARGR